MATAKSTEFVFQGDRCSNYQSTILNKKKTMNPTRARITHFFRNKLSVAVFSLLTASTASADDLLEIFNLAVTNDPAIRQQRATYNASHEQLDQGRSFL